MAIKRQTRTPKQRVDIPQWALGLLDGRAPERDSEAWGAYLGWKYFGDSVAGLPLSRTTKGKAILAALSPREPMPEKSNVIALPLKPTV